MRAETAKELKDIFAQHNEGFLADHEFAAYLMQLAADIFEECDCGADHTEVKQHA